MDVLTDHFRSPFHRGIPSDINWRSSRANPVCGDEITVGLQRNEQGRLSAFQEGRGCLISQASASLLCEEIDGWTLDELQRFTPEDLLDLFEFDLTPRRQRCALLAYEALQQLLQESNGS